MACVGRLLSRRGVQLLCIGLLLGGACTRTGSPPSAPRATAPSANTCPVASTVESLSDLDAQPAIEFRPGCTARFGVSAREVSQGSGVLVYCLLESRGTADLQLRFGDDITALGPCSLRWLGVARPEDAKVERTALVLPARSHRLFVTVVPVCFEGTRELGIYLDAAGIVAKTRLTGRKPPAQAWYPLLSDHGHSCLAAPEVLPAFSGDSSVLPEDLKGGELPTLIPAHEGQLDFRARRKSFDISPAPGLSTRPERQILVRLWVNGKPVLWSGRPTILGDRGTQSEALKGVARTVNWRRFVPDLKRGDELTVQLLLSPAGWVYARDEVEGLTPEWPRSKSLLSQKVVLRCE